MHTETAIKPRRQMRGPAAWAQFIAAQPGSGLSVDAYCRKHKLSPSGFYTWRQRLQKKVVLPGKQAKALAPEPASLLDLGTQSLAASPGWEVEVDVGAGIVLRLRKS